jgi:CBS domain-containing protein
MKLREIMTRNVEAISADASLTEAADRMARLDIGFLPVLDNKRVVGAVTDRDLVVRGLAEIRDPKATTVEEVMTRDLKTVSADEDVEQAAKMMEEQQIRRLVVTDDDGGCVGVVSLGDLSQKLPDLERCGEVLDHVCRP